jgi:hypothetical protein
MLVICVNKWFVVSRHAFVAFDDDSAAAAAVKQGATFKSIQLKVAFQTKRAEPQKRSAGADDESGLLR